MESGKVDNGRGRERKLRESDIRPEERDGRRRRKT